MGNLYNYLVAFGAAMGGLLFGYEIGVIGQVLVMDTFGIFFGIREPDAAKPGKFKDVDGHYADITGNITMTFLLGCLAGAAIVSWMADFLGRKRSILIGGILFNVGGVLQVVCQTLPVLYVGRVISGLGIGILSMVVPLFIAEVAPTHLRGRMVTVQQLMITIGILIASIINAIIIKTTEGKGNLEWRLALGMQLVPGVAVVLLNLFMPFSPRWLANRDRDAQAQQVIAKLRSANVDDPIVQAEFREIKESIELERQVGTASWSELLKPGIRNRVFFAFMLQLFQQWTGINFILYYAPKLIEAMGFDKDAASIPFNIANNFVNFIGTFPGMYLVERAGRRKLLMWGALLMGISQYVVCLGAGLSKEHGGGWAWLSIFGIYGFFLGFASTWGPIVWVYQSEIFPLRVRGKGTGVGTMSNWGWNAVIAKIGPPMTAKIDFWVYMVFGSIALGMGAFVALFIPETMGKSLEEMDEVFGATNGNRSIESGDVELKGKKP